MIYFIQSACHERFKIGYATALAARISAIQSTPHAVTVLGVLPSAGLKTEARLLKKFAHARYRGEWFYPVADLTDYITERTKKYVPIDRRRGRTNSEYTLCVSN
jgi:Meiotically Up-regulated Gene 113 (MUG113) protein